jgi:uncharacterized glyoxalase superfamily protein PhnB
MINYQVEDLDALLEALKAEGVKMDPKQEDHGVWQVCLDH